MLDYSVLMSVYAKEKPEFLQQSIESMYLQTAPTNDFILICDGPLTEQLDRILRNTREMHPDTFRVIRLKSNGGLGNALREGTAYCRNELIARMDSDDISLPTRCEKELQAFEENPELSIVSGSILEFQYSVENVTGRREVPEKQEEIIRFSQKRNPFNHVAVMMRKSAVLEAGGYRRDYPFFEDYDLWIRMLRKGFQGRNLKDDLVYVRAEKDMYERRGGKEYASQVLGFHKHLKQIGWTDGRDYLTGAFPHALVCMLPAAVRARVYALLRH